MTARGGADVLLLSCGVPLEIVGSTATGRLRLRAGEATCFAVQHRSSWEAPAPPWTQEAIARRLDETAECWRS